MDARTPPSAETARAADGALLSVSGLSKSFPGVRALHNVDFDLKPGEVHCLIGENGAGKSTLVKIIAGVQAPDDGDMQVNGVTASFSGPLDAQNAGIACIFQELTVVDGLTIAENIALGDEPGSFGIFRQSQARKRAEQLLASIGFTDLPVTRLCGKLSPAEKQAVMIAKALRQNTRIIIMDEPTSPLEDAEVRKLFDVIERLKAAGKGIIYVSHKMREIDLLGDRITVFKDGERVATLNRGEATSEDLVQLMVGRELSNMFPAKSHSPGDIALEVRGLTGPSITDVSFDVRHGEVLGIAGLAGAGRTELLRSIFGADIVHSGTVSVDGRRIGANSVIKAIQAGIGLVPEERRSQGIVPVLTVGDNAGIVWDQFPGQRDGASDRTAAVSEIVDLLKVKTPSLSQRISTLSGGNQQKVVLGKWLLTKTQVMLLDEPTRGIDVGAKREIYQIINDFAEKGLAVVLVSSELPELLGLSDRIIVINGGRIVGELPGDVSEEEVIAVSMLHAERKAGTQSNAFQDN